MLYDASCSFFVAYPGHNEVSELTANVVRVVPLFFRSLARHSACHCAFELTIGQRISAPSRTIFVESWRLSSSELRLCLCLHKIVRAGSAAFTEPGSEYLECPAVGFRANVFDGSHEIGVHNGRLDAQLNRPYADHAT